MADVCPVLPCLVSIYELVLVLISFLQVNITLQAWDKGSPDKSSTITIPLDIITYSDINMNNEERIKLDINENLPPGKRSLSSMLHMF